MMQIYVYATNFHLVLDTFHSFIYNRLVIKMSSARPIPRSLYTDNTHYASLSLSLSLLGLFNP